MQCVCVYIYISTWLFRSVTCKEYCTRRGLISLWKFVFCKLGYKSWLKELTVINLRYRSINYACNTLDMKSKHTFLFSPFLCVFGGLNSLV